MDENKRQTYRRAGYGRAEKIKNSDLYRELAQYQEAGVPLWLNGKPSSSFHIADCVCEKTDYMRDYHMDCQNRVCGIGFDRIRKDSQKETEFIPRARKLKQM